MGLYHVKCLVCQEPTIWFSGNPDQRCELCKIQGEQVSTTIVYKCIKCGESVLTPIWINGSPVCKPCTYNENIGTGSKPGSKGD